MEIVFVLAVAENGVIGADGGIPWRLKSDMQRFKALTIGKPVVMGQVLMGMDPASPPDPKKIAQMLAASPVHTVAIETKNAFNGTWQTDAKMHKLLSKDVKVHEAFTGRFEVEKTLKFHENPVKEKEKRLVHVAEVCSRGECHL